MAVGLAAHPGARRGTPVVRVPARRSSSSEPPRSSCREEAPSASPCPWEGSRRSWSVTNAQAGFSARVGPEFRSTSSMISDTIIAARALMPGTPEDMNGFQDAHVLFHRARPPIRAAWRPRPSQCRTTPVATAGRSGRPRHGLRQSSEASTTPATRPPRTMARPATVCRVRTSRASGAWQKPCGCSV